MKNFKRIMLFVAFIVVLFVAEREWVGKYSKTAIVKANVNGWIIARDENGKEYSFDDKERVFEIGDCIEMKLSDNGTTETMTDDYVIRAVKIN